MQLAPCKDVNDQYTSMEILGQLCETNDQKPERNRLQSSRAATAPWSLQKTTHMLKGYTSTNTPAGFTQLCVNLSDHSYVCPDVFIPDGLRYCVS